MHLEKNIYSDFEEKENKNVECKKVQMRIDLFCWIYQNNYVERSNWLLKYQNFFVISLAYLSFLHINILYGLRQILFNCTFVSV